ncbi:hypothetical protein CGMCC3_g1110 [Colletotrichum fructicola]|uniref:Uncharacterized protein n=1 Tax=Colletotrichum fructicola (strain Nara gc5) TaxID=1213859 RepID=A0A7J6IU05_COLFN|nr:uncharacterized protein CGMCC3_g1110 [Colletotrichum fructicola]KAE9583107.1 hypothetical protein CGMCC3_g1110 [Colletotrichum fructicola]KAF4412778.1 hypothetical protein CFRS1_v002558 [Colletotrichum fructicola]KAF4480548.1 hypothetical protein CGGC5_v010870 [Colletotrichum fructicola Nara gc5]KAF5487756.1 hypothetical protein CGCF413_v012443 [Colletotrichum fructicola]
MSYYENNPQWSNPGQNNWEHQAPPVRAGASGPTAQDDFAFFYQFEDVVRTLTARPTEVDRAYENLAKSGKSYGMGGRREYPTPGGPKMGPAGPGPARKSLDFTGRMGAGAGAGPRPHSMNQFDDARGHPNSNLQNFYASQRHQSSRGSNDAEQMMQAKRRMAAQRERELRNLHTEQQYQRTVVSDIPYGNKAMSEEETRELIARQRSALYGEGQFAEKGGYVDETGAVRPGVPGHSGPSSLRGQSPLTYDITRGPPPHGDANTPVSVTDGPGPIAGPPGEQGSRAGSTASPQPNAPNNKSAFESAVSQAAARTNNSSPGGSPPRQEMPGSKPAQTVAPIGTRPSGTPTGASNSSSKRSTTPLASPGGWGRGNGVWGPQSSGLSQPPASVWG